jgi:predicted transposase/invertase (TIGR01784 family)
MEEIFQRGKKVEDMEYALEKIMKKERMDALEEGEKEGIEKGIEKNKIEVAKKLIEQGAEMAFIIKITELTEEEIVKVKNSL